MALTELEPVESRLLDAVGYDEPSSTLLIRFRNGDLYSFFMVPKSVYLSLISTGSKGSFFLSNIRDAYPFKRTRG